MQITKFSLREAVRKIHLDATQLPEMPITGAAVDSRLVQPGNIFFALPGAKTDGHHFIGQALERGAIAAVVSKTYSGAASIPLIHADDALAALQTLSKAVLDAVKPRIVGITGSVGKTTTKDFITTLLQQKYRVASSPGNSNSQIGLPLSIINHLKSTDEALVLEMGMTHPGNIANLVTIACPEIAVLISVEMVHTCNFNGLEDIARTKAEIFSNPGTKLGVVARDIIAFDEVFAMGQCRKVTFSIKDQSADYFLKEKSEHITIFDHDNKTRLPLLNILGKHNLHNFLAAYVVATAMQMNRDEIAKAIPLLRLPARRLERIEKDGAVFINDSYNASTVAIKAALDCLPKPKPGSKTIAVIGEMKQHLGPVFSDMCHKEAGEAALAKVDQMLCYGEGCRPIYDVWKQAHRPVELFTDFVELTAALKKQVQPGDVVLIKGSNYNQLWRIVEGAEGQA